MVTGSIAQTNMDVKDKSLGALSSFAMMQADMAAAVKQNQQKSRAQKDGVKTDHSNKKLVPVPTEAELDIVQLSRVIEMAWEDRTPFEAIAHSYGLDETAVIKLMRQQLKPSSFRLWRQRVTNRATKHQAKRPFDIGRAYCKTQYKLR